MSIFPQRGLVQLATGASRVWKWLQRYWWVPVGFLVLLGGCILGGFLRREEGGLIVDPLRDVRDRIRENNERIDAAEAEAEMERDLEVERIEQEHAETLARLDEDQRKRAEEYRSNPRRLARWLTKLAKDQ